MSPSRRVRRPRRVRGFRAVGALAEICRRHGVAPAPVHASADRVAELHALLRDQLGVRLEWPEVIRRRLPEPDEADGHRGVVTCGTGR